MDHQRNTCANSPASIHRKTNFNIKPPCYKSIRESNVLPNSHWNGSTSPLLFTVCYQLFTPTAQVQKLFSTCAKWCAGDFSVHTTTTRCLIAKRRGPRMTPAGCFACVVRQADGAMCAPVDARSQAFRYGKVTLCSWRLKKIYVP